MRIFMTGATGFVGGHVAQELLASGYGVVGLARSDASAKALSARGVEVHPGDLEDVEALKRGAAEADAVIHVGFSANAADFAKSCETDKQAIKAIGSALSGSEKPFIVTSGLGALKAAPGELVNEETSLPEVLSIPRRSEPTALSLLSKSVRVCVMRLSQMHNTTKQGLVTLALAKARERGMSAYVGEGANRWAAAHVEDAARLYRLALENFETGAKWHAVAEEGIAMVEIAQVIGSGLKVPVKSIPAQEAQAHFGWWGWTVGTDLTASSALTRRKLDWRPIKPGLLADLEGADFT